MANETYLSPTISRKLQRSVAALLLRGAYFGALKLALETALSKPRLGTTWNHQMQLRNAWIERKKHKQEGRFEDGQTNLNQVFFRWGSELREAYLFDPF